MKYLLLTFSIIASITLISCSNGADSPRGFSLPEGDAQAGKAVFLKYQCLSCHTLKGVEQEGVHKNAEISVAPQWRRHTPCDRPLDGVGSSHRRRRRHLHVCRVEQARGHGHLGRVGLARGIAAHCQKRLFAHPGITRGQHFSWRTCSCRVTEAKISVANERGRHSWGYFRKVHDIVRI